MELLLTNFYSLSLKQYKVFMIALYKELYVVSV